MPRIPRHASLFLLALLLGSSLGAKLVLGGASGHRAAGEAAKQQLAAALARHGYEVTVAPDPESPFVAASRDGCEMLVASVAPQGWHRDILAQVAHEGDVIRYLVEGEMLPEQPVWRTSIAYYRQRLGRFLGQEAAGAPPYGVIAPAGCDLDPAVRDALSPPR